MSVYYKFKSARDYDSIPIDGHFISVAYLKERIFESKHLGRGTDFDLMVSNAQTNEEYVDEATLIPKNTSVLVRRVPGRPRKPIVTQQEEPKPIEEHVEEVPQHNNSSLPVADSSAMKFPEESEWDEFGNDLYAIPEVLPAQSSNPVVNVPTNNVDEESKLKALIDTPALEWQRQGQENYGPGRGFGRGMGGRMIAGRGCGRAGSGLERKTPPQGYICHRCKVPGHFIQHCPTNGDPNFDIRRVKPPTGIPKSMLMQTPDGSYALPSGAVAVLKPNEAAFEKEIEGMPSTRPVTDLPPELRCPLCKEVMKDAVLTSKCCFSSFCDKCIRDHIISKSMCVCGFTNILADDLLPNKTLRETISRIMESTATSSAENDGSLLHIQDMESARPLPSKVPSPTLSATKEEVTLPPVEHARMIMDSHLNGEKEAIAVTKSQDNTVKNAEVSERTPESLSAKATSQESAPVHEEVTQEKLLPNEQGKKKKKKKTRPPGGASDMQWRGYPELGVDNFTGMPMPPAAYNQYIPGMPWGMDGYMAPFPAGPMPMGYPQGPFDVPFGGVLPQDPFAAQAYMMPILPQRDLSELSFGGFNKNPAPPIMSREELEARKADQRKRDIERHSERARSRDREIHRDMSSIAEKSSLKPKPKLMSQAAATMDRPGRGKSPIRSSSARDSARRASPPLPSRPLKRKSDPEEATVGDRKMKGSVFSRISFPDSGKDGSSKKKNKSSDPPNGLKDHHETTHRREERRQPTKSSSAGGGRRTGNAYDHESSEEEYHFKRRPSSSSRLEQATEWEDDERPSRGSRERERARDHDHERLAKHR